ncbi:MAG: histidine kinase [Flavobacteriales bacterium]|nr:histidine kinase [Flavobacteriales bacterium]
MVIDTQDRLWIVNKGVLMIDTRSGTFRRFDRNDGLLSLPDGDAGILVTRDGRLVLHVDDEPRLQVFRVADLLREPAAPTIELLRIRTRTSNTAPDQMAANGSAMRIKEADLPLQIEFAAIDLSRPFAYQYAYRILGRDSAWHALGPERSVQFASLEAGQYQVEFRSLRGGRALDNVKRITFIITPPWYRTVLAQIMAVLLVILAVFILFRIRLRSVRKEERRKAAFQKQLAEVEMHALRAQMNPHFLFNSLNSIKYYAMTKTPRETADYLGTFAMLIRRILQNSREDLVPLKDELEALRLYIEIESLRLEDKFDHRIHVAEDIDPEQLRLPPMLVQPYVENAIWHGLMNKEERGTLTVDISMVSEELRIMIEDDGVGRAKAEEIKNKIAHRERSFGMRITAERMELAAQTLGLGLRSTVEDLVDPSGSPCGTRVVLFIPLMHEDIT